MGCAQSKIENEETVTRCKERRHFMKESVASRNAFAAAHSAYAMSLKNTGAALSDYAHGEVQFPSSSAAAGPPVGGVAAAGVSQPSYESFPPPPPPLPPFTGSPLQRAATMPEMAFPKPGGDHTQAIIEEEEEEMETESVHELKHRSSKSSGAGLGGGGGGILRQKALDEDDLAAVPPSPPPPRRPIQNDEPPPPPPPDNQTWDYFLFSTDNVPGPSLEEMDENRISREVIEQKMQEERAEREELGGGGGGGRKSAAKVEEVEVVEKPVEVPPQPPQAVVQPKAVKKAKQVVVAEGKRKGGSIVNLLQVFTELDDCFLKASESAHEVSKMLEATRLHYHSNFADNRGIRLSDVLLSNGQCPQS